MKKMLSLVLSLSLMATMLIGVLPVAAASTASTSVVLLEEDYTTPSDAVAKENMLSTFPNLYACSNVRVLSQYGRYVCATGGASTCALVYKMDIPEGKLNALSLDLFGRFFCRDGYNADWTASNSYAHVYVSTDGSTWGEPAVEWDYTILKYSDYSADSSYSHSSLKDQSYTADLTAAVADAETIFVKVEWKGYDHPTWSTVKTVKFTADVSEEGEEEPEIPSGEPTETNLLNEDYTTPTGAVAKENMLSTFPNLYACNNVRVLSQYGRYVCATGGASTCSMIYKVDIPAGELIALTLNLYGRFFCRDGYSADWTASNSYAHVYVSTDGSTWGEPAVEWDYTIF